MICFLKSGFVTENPPGKNPLPMAIHSAILFARGVQKNTPSELFFRNGRRTGFSSFASLRRMCGMIMGGQAELWGGFHENDYHNPAYTIGSPYKWDGWLLDGLGAFGIGGKSGKTNRREFESRFCGKKFCHLFLRLAAGETDSGDCRRVFRGNANIAEGIERKKSRKMLRKVSSMAAGEYGTAGKDD